jgi:3-dehydroquinate synthase
MRLGDGNNLILTGFMGTGKSSVGREIARRTGRAFVDMDRVIEEREGKSISEIFGQNGEAYFRQIEADLCRELAAKPELSKGTGVTGAPGGRGQVIATGGGALLNPDSRKILGASGPIICLTASTDEILRRLGPTWDRPLLDAADRNERITELLEQRAEAYRSFQLQVGTDGLSIYEAADEVMARSTAPKLQTQVVRHPGGEYAIHLGRGLLSRVGDHLAALQPGSMVTVITNPVVGMHYQDSLIEGLESAGFDVRICSVPDGEEYKSLETVRDLYDSFIQEGLDRKSTVLALGGGVIGDMAGFAAATYLRGVSFVQVPTTVLAMVDSSVGGKVAVDHPRGKNLIGAFKHPLLVAIDPDTLITLPEREHSGGLAEAVKTALIGDPELFGQIEEHGPAPISWIIERAIQLKVDVVEKDPYEQGHRALLNLGHTFGHALELLSGYSLSHGEGVSIGLVAAARLSARLGLCPRSVGERTENVLERLGLPVRYESFSPDEVWEAMSTDKKRRGSRLRFVLLGGLGEVLVSDEVRKADVYPVLESLRLDPAERLGRPGSRAMASSSHACVHKSENPQGEE